MCLDVRMVKSPITQKDIDRRQLVEAEKYRKRAARAIQIIQRPAIYLSADEPHWKHEARRFASEGWYREALYRQAALYDN